MLELSETLVETVFPPFLHWQHMITHNVCTLIEGSCFSLLLCDIWVWPSYFSIHQKHTMTSSPLWPLQWRWWHHALLVYTKLRCFAWSTTWGASGTNNGICWHGHMGWEVNTMSVPFGQKEPLFLVVTHLSLLPVQIHTCFCQCFLHTL